jgi:quercetin dioxygenase-like cupin family protein
MSTVHRFLGNEPDYKWDEVLRSTYPNEELKGITKYLLVGKDDHAKNFEMRFFQFEPGSKSDLTRHPKENIFYILEGLTRLQINQEFYDLKPNDVVFVSKNDLIQFVNMGDHALRFINVTEIIMD